MLKLESLEALKVVLGNVIDPKAQFSPCVSLNSVDEVDNDKVEKVNMVDKLDKDMS